MPPLGDATQPRPDLDEPTGPKPITEKEAESLRKAVLFKDAEVIVLNKPAGLAVQGGTGLDTSIDAMLDALQLDAPERPRLVHRLDAQTSGVIVAAKTQQIHVGFAIINITAPVNHPARTAERVLYLDRRVVAWGLPDELLGRTDLAAISDPGVRSTRWDDEPSSPPSVTKDEHA